MNRPPFILLLMSAFLLTFVGPGTAEEFPSKEVTMIVPYAAGGGSDLIARVAALAAEKILGKPIVVINKPGANAVKGMTELAHAKADGYTIGTFSVPLLTVKQMGLAQVDYKDFDGIVALTFSPQTISVRTDSKWKTAGELFAEAKQNPNKIRVALAGAGGALHVAGLSLMNAGIPLKLVIFEKGAAPGIIEVVGGHLEATTGDVSDIAAQVKAGKLRALAVFGSRRLDSHPDVPAMKELGLDLPPIGAFRGVLAPKGVPPERLKKLEAVFKKAMESDEFKEFARKNSFDLMPLSSAEFNKFLAEQTEAYGRILKEVKK